MYERLRGYFSSVKGTEDDFVEVNRALFERQMLNDIVKCAQSKEDLDPKYPSPDLKKRCEAIKQVYEKADAAAVNDQPFLKRERLLSYYKK